ncbi:MAG TPA: hypothetical protein VI819_04975 [Patescibacteria group bacterium]|nr:hypothetical protein [Patescibacteria group bacterium]
MLKILKTFIFGFSIYLLLGFTVVHASDGTFELRSTTELDYKCFAASLQMQTGSYRVIVSCRNILYPVDGSIYTYILWANPVAGGDPFALGQIGLGKGEYVSKVPFASLFITTEKNAKTKLPAGEVVMRGSVKPITFLEKPTENLPENPEATGEESQESPTPTPEKSSVRDKVILGLKRAGLASGLALVAIIGLVFVLTRPK